MAIDSNALFLNVNSVYGAASLGLMARDTISEGVTTAGGLAVSQRGAGANMSVDIAAGSCWVAGTEDPAQPTYRVRATGVTNVAIGASDATNPRIDLITVNVRDSQFSGGDNDTRFLVVAGTPAASPAPPAIPDNTLVLAQVLVGAQVTEITATDITDARDLAGVRASFLLDGSVDTDTIADAAVTNAKIADGTIQWQKIAEGTIVNSRLADNAISTAKIADAAVTGGKLNLTRSALTSNAAQSDNDTAIGGLTVTPAGGTYLMIATARITCAGTFAGETPVGVSIRRAGTTVITGTGGFPASAATGTSTQVTASGFVDLNGSQQVTVTKNVSVTSTAVSGQCTLTYLRVG